MGKALQCQATMRLPGRKTANGKRKEKESERRKQISEAFLRERLGLEDDWIERWSEGDELREESLAPGELPRFIRARIEQDAKTDKDVNIPQEMRDVKKAVESLVAAGCRRRVVYFCLEELSPEAGAIRAGRRRRSILTQDGEYDLLPGREPPPRRPTREHMKALSNQAK